MTKPPLDIAQPHYAVLCRCHSIRRFALFGFHPLARRSPTTPNRPLGGPPFGSASCLTGLPMDTPRCYPAISCQYTHG